MTPIDHIRPSDYDYELPSGMIAEFPTENRDESRLLIRGKDGKLCEDIFKNLALHLPPESGIFFNNSKVIPARLIFTTSGGSKVEIFCLHPIEPFEFKDALGSRMTCEWECMIRNARRFKEPLKKEISAGEQRLILTAEKKTVMENSATIRFKWDNPLLSFSEIISYAGQTPLPPYIKRAPIPSDRENYQTVYSKVEGSVAAPTAGLHFTDKVMESLLAKNIRRHEITLHVGAGTFQPVKTESVRDHKMHAEYFEVTRELAEELSLMKERVTCVGTTTVRTLESIYWIGAKLAGTDKFPDFLNLEQWEPYSINECSVNEAFNALLKWLESRKTSKVTASTRFMIVPGYRFKMTERLITNFHQPRSSLLMLIAAFIGEHWKETYHYALKKGFRFLSYGDSSLLFNGDLIDQ